MSQDKNNEYSSDSLQAELVLSKSDVAVGESIQLTINVNIVEGDYIYAYVPQGKPYLQTLLETQINENIALDSDWVLPAGEFVMHDPDILVHRGFVKFTQEINITQKIDLSSIKVLFRFQCCNEMSCTMPVTCELEHSLNIL